MSTTPPATVAPAAVRPTLPSPTSATVADDENTQEKKNSKPTLRTEEKVAAANNENTSSSKVESKTAAVEVPPVPQEEETPAPPHLASQPCLCDEDDDDMVLFLFPANKLNMPLKTQAIRFAVALLVCLLFLCYMLNITTNRYPDPKTQDTLPDFAMEAIPKELWMEHLTDVCVWIGNISSFVILWFLYKISKGEFEPRKGGSFLLRKGFTPVETIHVMSFIRYMVTFATMTFLRAIVVVATILPATDNKCQKRPHIDNWLYNTIIGILTFGGGNIHCGDLLFSGHTISIAISAMSMITYGPLIHPIFVPLALVTVPCSWVTMLASRSHYTDDILIALYMTVTTFLIVRHDGRKGAPKGFQIFVTNPFKLYDIAYAAWGKEKEEKKEEGGAAQHTKNDIETGGAAQHQV